jgi:Fic family protein
VNIVLDRLKEEKEMRLKGCLYHYTQIKFAYNTNRIEGSRLTEDETRYIYETFTISTGENKTANVNDIIETVNHFSCFNYLLEVAEKPLSEEIIKEFHNILKRGSSDSFKDWFKIGDYKTRENMVGDIETALPSEVNKKMKSLLSEYLKENIDFNKIIDFHYNFEKIHPFQDGNGRVGRLVMFKECLKNNIVPFIIEDEKKQFYYMGLKEYPNSKTRLIETCLYSQDIYKDVLKYFKIDYDDKIINNNENKK